MSPFPRLDPVDLNAQHRSSSSAKILRRAKSAAVPESCAGTMEPEAMAAPPVDLNYHGHCPFITPAAGSDQFQHVPTRSASSASLHLACIPAAPAPRPCSSWRRMQRQASRSLALVVVLTVGQRVEQPHLVGSPTSHPAPRVGPTPLQPQRLRPGLLPSRSNPAQSSPM